MTPSYFNKKAKYKEAKTKNISIENKTMFLEIVKNFEFAIWVIKDLNSLVNDSA